MAAPKRTQARLEEIKRRQIPQRWGKDYLPAIRATRSEAPGISSPHILRCDRWGGREIHLLSAAEVRVALLALYNPSVVEIHEQRALSPYPCPNPIVGFSHVAGDYLPPLRGTIDVTRRLGVQKNHPTVLIRTAKGDHGYVPFPYIGDLLLFLREENDYCVNGSVKLNADDFRRRLQKCTPLDQVDEVANEALDLRHRIEEMYYSDGAIATKFIPASRVDDHVYFNLRDLFCALLVRHELTELQWLSAAEYMRSAIERRETGASVVRHFQRSLGQGLFEAIALFKKIIWRREARVDLFEPIALDRPLLPEKRDALEVYAPFFTPGIP